ncbi:hypothetical protein LDENG_00001820 [Lucifuga dentata]|nr:hypothetical protein LDENG_00001820 [Lucifuga dentata]
MNVALLHIMTGCCITNRHGITQIITKETRTNSQPSHLLIGPTSKQKCRITQITQSVFHRIPHGFQPHKNPSNVPKLLII